MKGWVPSSEEREENVDGFGEGPVAGGLLWASSVAAILLMCRGGVPDRET